MSKIGTSTIYGTILPNNQALSKINPVKLSKKAKMRLDVIDYYYKESAKHSQNNKPNIALTARRFGVSRSFVYKWLGRYNPNDLTTLESKSTRPHSTRSKVYDYETVKRIRQYREDENFSYMSAKKLAVIFKTSEPAKFHISAATIGRIIKKFDLFFNQPVKVIKKKSFKSKLTNANNKLKKRYYTGLRQDITNNPDIDLIEFDMKHIYANNKKYYAFCAINPITKESVIHVANTSTSRQAKIALEKTVATFSNAILILNDNGSENFKEAWDYLESQQIVQCFTHPHSPKEKPFVERLIGSLQREYLAIFKENILNLENLKYYTNRWLNNYHYIRPHQSLNYLTPQQYCDTMGITIQRRVLSTM